MLTALYVILAVLVIIHGILTAVDYFCEVPIWLYRVQSYIAYSISVMLAGMIYLFKGEPVTILFSCLLAYFGSKAIMNYIDYKYTNREEAEKTEESEESEESEGTKEEETKKEEKGH